MIINLSDKASLNLAKPPYDTEGLTCAILGNKGSGKSNTMAVMAEEFHAVQIPFIYYDPNGDAASLCELGPDVILVGDPDHIEKKRRAQYPLNVAANESKEFIRMVLIEGYSLVIDMSEPDDTSSPPPLEVFIRLMNEHYRQAGKLREPCAIFVDEAHMVAPQIGATDLEKYSRRALGKVATDGRKRGMVLVTATQRATYLDKRILFGANVRIFGKVTYFPDYDIVKHYIPASFHQIRALKSGEVYIVSEKRYGKTRIKRRKTTDLGKTPAFKPRKRIQRPDIRQLQFPFKVRNWGRIVDE